MNLPEKPMTKVYVCSPFRPVSIDPKEAEKEKQRNINLAKNACELVVKLGFVPIAPHLYFPQFLNDDDPKEREEGMLLGRELLCGCDELWAFGGRISEGMEAEIKQAKASDIPVRYCDASLDVTLRLIELGERYRLKDLKWKDNRACSFAEKVGNYVGINPMDISLIINLYELISDNEVCHES